MKEISALEVQQQLENGQTVHIIDVREAEEIAEGHIENMIHIPLGLLEFKLQDLDKKESYVVVCRSGGRSGQATLLLQQHGFDATNMVGGMLGWNGKTV